MSPWSNQKPALGQQLTLMKHVTSISSKLEPTIWLCDTGQWIAWFYRCQLIITWCHTSKKYTVNQGSMFLSTYYLDYGRHVAWLYHRRSRRAYVPTRNTAGPDNMRKSIHGFPLFPYIGMGLRLAARRAAGAPLLIYWLKSETDFLVIKASSLLWLDFFLLNVLSPQGASFVVLKAALDFEVYVTTNFAAENKSALSHFHYALKTESVEIGTNYNW